MGEIIHPDAHDPDFMRSYPLPWRLLPPWTSSDQEEVWGAYVAAALPATLLVLGSLGRRTVSELEGLASLMVCTFPGKVPLFHFQCQCVPSLQPESGPDPLPGSGRWGPPEQGRWAGQPLDGVVGEQAQGKSIPWAGSDWPAAEVCKEALLVASHRAERKQMNQSPSLNSEVAEEFHKDSRWLTTNSVAW